MRVSPGPEAAIGEKLWRSTLCNLKQAKRLADTMRASMADGAIHLGGGMPNLPPGPAASLTVKNYFTMLIALTLDGAWTT
jgi:hypothetical protein